MTGAPTAPEPHGFDWATWLLFAIFVGLVVVTVWS